MKKRVLVVAGNAALRAALAQILQPAGYSIERADGKKRACALIAAGKIDAALIAPGSLGELGQDLANELCGMTDRVIVLDEGTRLIGNRAEPTDVGGKVPQTVKQDQLLSRLAELLSADNNTIGDPPAFELLRFAGRTVDLVGRTFHNETGREVALTHAEFDLLTTFLRRPGWVLSRDYLRSAVAGRGIDPDERSIDMLVARLRRKIELDPKNPQFILTVQGEGYKFPLRPQRVERPIADTDSVVSEPREAAHLRYERRQMTVLACRISGLALTEDPETLYAAMTRVHQVVGQVVERFGGRLIVDVHSHRLFVHFGYPEAQEDDAERAVRAALEIVRVVPDVAVGSMPKMDLHVGVASGVMLVDSPDASQTHSAIGQPLNFALELRSVAPPGAVVVADDTRALVGSLFDYEHLKPLILEKDAPPICVWRVVATNVPTGRFDALRRAGMPALVDRAEQMDLLWRRWQKAKNGAGQIVVLTGEPGIGKSRLVAEMQSRLSAEPEASLQYFGAPYQTDASMFTLICELQRACGFTRTDAATDGLRKLERVLQAANADSGDNVAILADLLSLPVEGQRAARFSPKDRKARIFGTLLARIKGMAARQPVVVVVEDIQWIDPTSLEFLTILGESLSVLPILMLVTSRPKFTLPWPEHAFVTVVELPRLALADAELLLEQIAGETLPKVVMTQILAPAEGIPLFVEELTKAVLETGVPKKGGEAYETGVGHSQTIPNTLRGSLIARLDRLGSAKNVAQVGAVIGREFSYELLRTVTPMEEPALRSSLDRLGASELVFCRGVPPFATYLFKHALVRDAAYGMLVRAKKQELHETVARALEEKFPDIIEVQPALLAHHYREAGNSAKEAHYMAAACERSLSHSALKEFDRQVSQAAEAISVLPEDDVRLRLQIRLATARARRVIAEKGYAHQQTRDAYGEALALSSRIGDDEKRLDALYGLWVYHFVGGEPVIMLDRANEFLALAESQAESGPKVIGHRLVGTSRLMLGDIGGATSALQEALRRYGLSEYTVASPVGQALLRRFVQDLGVTVHSYLSWALWLGGKPDGALQHAKVAEQKGREAKGSGHTLSLMYALWHAGMVYMLRGDRDDVERVGRELTDLASGRPYWLALGDFLLGWHAGHSGRPASGIDLLKRGIFKRWEKTGSRIFRPICLGFLAGAYTAANEPELAKRSLEDALETAKRTEERWAEPEIHRLFGELAVHADPVAAITHYRQAIKVAREQESRSFQLRATISLSRTLSDQGRQAEAADLLAEIYGAFNEGFDTPDLRDAKALLVRLQSAPQKRGR